MYLFIILQTDLVAMKTKQAKILSFNSIRCTSTFHFGPASGRVAHGEQIIWNIYSLLLVCLIALSVCALKISVLSSRICGNCDKLFVCVSCARWVMLTCTLRIWHWGRTLYSRQTMKNTEKKRSQQQYIPKSSETSRKAAGAWPRREAIERSWSLRRSLSFRSLALWSIGFKPKAALFWVWK